MKLNEIGEWTSVIITGLFCLGVLSVMGFAFYSVGTDYINQKKFNELYPIGGVCKFVQDEVRIIGTSKGHYVSTIYLTGKQQGQKVLFDVRLLRDCKE